MKEGPQPNAEVPRVLLVDDRRDNLLALEAVLQPLGFELLTTLSGTEALRILLNTEVSAIVLDVQMPDMDGFETASLLKARDATRSVPILFLTAVAGSVEHEIRGYEAGGVDYICKPFEPKVLQAKVRALVRWSSEVRAIARSVRVYDEAVAELENLGSLVESEPVGPDAIGFAAPLSVRSHPAVMQRTVDITLDPSLTAPKVARAAAQQAVDGVDEGLRDTVVLLVSELVSNTVLHVRSEPTMRLDVGQSLVRVEVQDAGTTMPDPVATCTDDERGRGLLLVQRLADRCGWTELDHGKLVWFELDVSRPAG